MKFSAILPAPHYRGPALQFDALQLQAVPDAVAKAPKRAQRDRYYTAARRLHWKRVMRGIHAG